MPNSRVCLTWAVPVDIMQLGPAFEAYATTYPKRHMLRLCNRFGKGNHVAINRLPAELLQHIESCIMQDARAAANIKWEEPSRCFEDRCDITDHFDEAEIRNLFFSLIHVCREDDCEGGCEDLTGDDIKELVEESLQNEGDSLAMRRHRQLKDLWLYVVGRPGDQDRGIFKEHEQILQQHFGLEVWTTYTQISHGAYKWDSSSCSYFTKAYLCLPGGIKGANSWKQDKHEDWDEDEGAIVVDDPSESSCEVEVTVPPPPSAQSLARFARAVRILGLSAPINAPVNATTADASSGDGGESMPCPSRHLQGPSIQPKQMMLISSGQDSLSWFDEDLLE